VNATWGTPASVGGTVSTSMTTAYLRPLVSMAWRSLCCPSRGSGTGENLRGANQVSSLGIETQDEGSKVVLMVLQVTHLKFWQISWGQGEATLNT